LVLNVLTPGRLGEGRELRADESVPVSFALLGISAFGDNPSRPARVEYDVLRSFPSGRLAALSAGDKPDVKGLIGAGITGTTAGSTAGSRLAPLGGFDFVFAYFRGCGARICQ